MNRRLLDIQDISAITHSAAGNIKSCQSIDFLSEQKGEGGIGVVHKVISIDGNPVERLVLKIVSGEKLKDEAYLSISLLHEKINKEVSLNGLPMYFEFPELTGLPFMIFRATEAADGQQVIGMLMDDLFEAGFEDMGSDDWNVVQYLEQVPIQDRIFLAYQYVRALDFLHRLNFIHCDLKEQSVFINTKLPVLTLIDFDGGFNYDKQKSGLTIGAVTAWATKKIKNAIRLGKSTKDFSPQERLEEELFYIASGVYAIMFGVSPYFFLRDYNEEVVLKYLKFDAWPAVEKSSELLNDGNLPAHQYCVSLIAQLRNEGMEKLMDAFVKSFNKGYKDEKRRLSAGEWKFLLENACKKITGKPKFENFSADKSSINKRGEPVKITWCGKYFKYASVNNDFYSYLDSSITLYPQDDFDIKLDIFGYFGKESEQLQIEANKVPPQIASFTSSVEKRIDLSPVVLSWKTQHTESIRISSWPESLPSNGQIEVDTKEKTEYRLTAIGNFGQEETISLEVDVLKPTIETFRYEINIENGIENIDLYWSVIDATETDINPRIGKVGSSGSIQVGIPEKTEFTLVAHGHFGTVTKTIEAKPFPIPLIKTLLVPTPDLRLDTFIPICDINIPDHVLKLPTFDFDSSINFNDTQVFTDLDVKLKGILENVPKPPLTEELLKKIYTPTK